MISRTCTRTWNVLGAWASTVADAVLTCPEDRCGSVMRVGEEIYRAVERDDQWRCWRHFFPDRGPIRV